MKDNRIDFKFFCLPNFTIEWDTPRIFRKIAKMRLFQKYPESKREDWVDVDECIFRNTLSFQGQQFNRAFESLFRAACGEFFTGRMKASVPPNRSRIDAINDLALNGTDGFEIALVDTKDNVLYIGPLVDGGEVTILTGSYFGFAIDGFWIRPPGGDAYRKRFEIRSVLPGDTIDLTYHVESENMSDGTSEGYVSRHIFMKFHVKDKW